MNPGNFFAELKRRSVSGGGRLCCDRVAASSGGVDFVPDFRSAGVGDESVCRRDSRGFRRARSSPGRSGRLTPQGIRRTEEVRPGDPATAAGERAPRWIFVVAIGALVSSSLTHWCGPAGSGQRSPSLPTFPTSRSAVLPFENLAKTRRTPISPKACRTRFSLVWPRSPT